MPRANIIPRCSSRPFRRRLRGCRPEPRGSRRKILRPPSIRGLNLRSRYARRRGGVEVPAGQGGVRSIGLRRECGGARVAGRYEFFFMKLAVNDTRECDRVFFRAIFRRRKARVCSAEIRAQKNPPKNAGGIAAGVSAPVAGSLRSFLWLRRGWCRSGISW